METEKDRHLWRLAKKRVSFRNHLSIYIIVNATLWIIWYLGKRDVDHNGFPWPVWPMFGWGIGLLFNFIGAYVTTGSDAIEKEYEKLKNKG